MVDIPWDKLLSQNPGDNVEAIGKLLQPAHDAVCQLYAAAPGWSLGPVGTVLSATGVSKLVFDSLCPSVPAPPPPQPAAGFTGGQCMCMQYTINFTDFYRNGTNTGPRTFTCYGPITKIGIEVNETGNPSSVVYCQGEFECQSIATRLNLENGSPAGSDYEIIKIQVNSVSPTGGEADNCGDPPGGYLPYPPPPDSARNSGGSINLNNGTTVNWNIRNNYDPTTNINNAGPYIPLDFHFEGDTNNYVPTTFSFGNVNFNFGGDGGHYINDGGPPAAAAAAGFSNTNNNINNVGIGVAGVGAAVGAVSGAVNAGNTINNDTNNMVNTINNTTKDCCKPKQPDPTKYDSFSIATTQGEVVSGVPNIAYVQIALSGETPANMVQFGSGSSPRVLQQGGWFAFTAGGTQGVRYPLDFDRKFFVAPDFADGFLLSCSHNSSASVVYFVLKDS